MLGDFTVKKQNWEGKSVLNPNLTEQKWNVVWGR